ASSGATSICPPRACQASGGISSSCATNGCQRPERAGGPSQARAFLVRRAMRPERRVGLPFFVECHVEIERRPVATELEEPVALAVAVELPRHLARTIVRFLGERL